MPYSHRRKLIPKELKKSAKLTDQDKLDMQRIYGEGGISYVKLGAAFNVSKRSAYFAVNPDKQKENYALRVKRRIEKGITYYNKEKNTAAMRKHRKYKQELHLENKLNNPTDYHSQDHLKGVI